MQSPYIHNLGSFTRFHFQGLSDPSEVLLHGWHQAEDVLCCNLCRIGGLGIQNPNPCWNPEKCPGSVNPSTSAAVKLIWNSNEFNGIHNMVIISYINRQMIWYCIYVHKWLDTHAHYTYVYIYMYIYTYGRYYVIGVFWIQWGNSW